MPSQNSLVAGARKPRLAKLVVSSRRGVSESIVEVRPHFRPLRETLRDRLSSEGRADKFDPFRAVRGSDKRSRTAHGRKLYVPRRNPLVFVAKREISKGALQRLARMEGLSEVQRAVAHSILVVMSRMPLEERAVEHFVPAVASALKKRKFYVHAVNPPREAILEVYDFLVRKGWIVAQKKGSMSSSAPVYGAAKLVDECSFLNEGRKEIALALISVFSNRRNNVTKKGRIYPAVMKALGGKKVFLKKENISTNFIREVYFNILCAGKNPLVVETGKPKTGSRGNGSLKLGNWESIEAGNGLLPSQKNPLKSPYGVKPSDGAFRALRGFSSTDGFRGLGEFILASLRDRTFSSKEEFTKFVVEDAARNRMLYKRKPITESIAWFVYQTLVERGFTK